MTTRRAVGLVLLALLLLGAGYKRADFKHWSDFDRDCKNTRAEVLEAQSLRHVSYSANGCAVSLGKWLDPYSGETFAEARLVDVDHIVPLAHAWQMGARDWDARRREAYANWEPGLLAVSASLNRQKGAKGPTEWLPPKMDRCEYIERFVEVKRQWGLLMSVEEAELWFECRP